jgi:lysophospholipase L1-like esterase
VADGGIAGEVSAAGPRHVRRYLDWFAGASCFVIGFGTNDLSMSTEVQQTSGRIVANMRSMASLVARQGKRVLLLNIPHVRSDCSPSSAIDELRRGRQYHNQQLANWCNSAEIPLIDICLPLADEHFADAVHPNEAGAQLIAETVFKTLGPLLGTGTSQS